MFRFWLRRLFQSSVRVASPRRSSRPRLEPLEDRTLLATGLLADLNTSASSSRPTGFATLGGSAFFFADDGVHGVELWKSDGTAAGTKLVSDINPGSDSSSLPNSPPPVVLGSALYFLANDAAHGTRLWKSDGTTAGTIPLTGDAPGAVAYLNQVAVASGLVFFADPATGELWKSNGTAAGTIPVTDSLGNPINSPLDLASVGGTLYLSGQQSGSSGHQTGLWKTDGTPGGTSFVQSIGGSISSLTDVGGTAYFVVTTAAANGQKDAALWKSNGTASSASLVHDFGSLPAAAPSPIADLTAFNGKLYFAADDRTANPDQGVELWTSDGTSGGTHLVKDVNPGSGSGLSQQAELTSFNGSLYFVANDGSGQALWQSNGMAGGTVKVLDAGGHTISSSGILQVVSNSTLYFAGSNSAGTGLWKTTGTAAGTVFVQSATIDASLPGSSTAVSSTLFFPASDGTHGLELWKSNGTAASTSMVLDVNTSTNSSPQSITNVNGTAYFAATDASHGTELWRSDGTVPGTHLVADVAPGVTGGLLFAGLPRLLNVNGTVYFFAYDGNPAHGSVQLWRSNGTAASTQLVKGFTPSQGGPVGYLAGLPSTLTNINSEVFFVADDGIHGLELWKNDGTTAGTVMVKDLNPGSGGSNPGELTVVGTSLFFTASDGTNRGLWKTDGTTTTFLQAGASNLANVNGTLYFTAPTAQNAPALWKTNGTTTTQIKSLGAGTAPRLLTNVNGTLYFAVDGAGTEALWTSDGTAGGTVALHSFSGQPLGELTALGSTLYFINNGSSGPELWTSNGTGAGTARVATLHSAFSPGFFDLTNINGTLLFGASDSHGQELWTSNGTAGGTGLLQDLNPGSSGSFPHDLTTVGGRLFFAANDGVHGTELFSDLQFSQSATTTSLSASATTVTLGQSVTFTAQVSATGAHVDGGSVTFLDGSTELGTAAVIGGSASLNVALGLGQHNVTAVYSGDVNFTSSTSSAVGVTVTAPAADTTTTLTTSATTVVQGQSVTLTATVKPAQGNVDGGSVDFKDGTTDLGMVNVDASGVAQLAKVFSLGTHHIIAVYSGDAHFNSSTSSTVTVTVTIPHPASTTTTLTASAGSVVQGETVTFTATVRPAQGNVDGGSVDFQDGSTDLGMVNVDANGVAALDVALDVGTHHVIAVYSGDASFSGSTSSAVAVTVIPQTPTTTILTASATSVSLGQPVTFTATASPAQGNVDGGFIDFQDGATDLGSVAVNASGVAMLAKVLSLGAHHIVAVYSGDALFSGSVSSAVGVTVNPPSEPISTSTILTASATSVPFDESVTFTATVTPSVGALDGGMVMFLDGGRIFASAPVDASTGVAVLTTILSPGTHDVTAFYFGDSNFSSSTSSAVTVTVGSPRTGDVTGSVEPIPGPVQPIGSGAFHVFSQSLTLVNIDVLPLQGPLYAVLHGLRNGTRLRGASGFVGRRRRRSPFIVIDPGSATLLPNGSVSVTLSFRGRPGPYTLSVFAGVLPL
jgi:ELWxxDGT repeat protein